MKAQKYIPLALVVAGLVAYHNSFRVPFLLDDVGTVVQNPSIRCLWPPSKLFLWPEGGGTVTGRPVLNLSFALNYAFGGLAVDGYHGLNLAIHVFAALTLFGVVRRTLLQPSLAGRYGQAATSLAFIVALIWTVHPLQTQSVTYLDRRAESLMGLLYLVTLYCFIRGVESRKRRLWFALSVASCLLGMATKESMVSAPLIVLLYDRTFVAGSFREAWVRRWPWYCSLAATWLPLGYLVAAAGSRGGTAGFDTTITWYEYALTQSWAIVRYLRLSIWPHPLIFDYGMDLTTRFSDVAPYVVAVALLLVGTAIALRRWPTIGLAGCWFLATMAPSSSVLPIVTQPIAEHRMYLPLAAVVTVAVLGAYTLGNRLLGSRKQLAGVLGWGLGGAVVVLLTAATIRRNQDYRSELAIWQDTIEKWPNNPRAHVWLGIALKRDGKVQDAIACFRQALRIKPDYMEAHFNLANALAGLGKTSEATEHYRVTVQLNPDLADARLNYGNALFRLGKPGEAIEQYREALRAKPGYAEAHKNLGYALLFVGQPKEASAHLEQWLRADPSDADSCGKLALALHRAGDVQGAIQQYERALILRPDLIEAQNNFAWLLSTVAPTQGGNPVRAVGLAQRACELTANRDAGNLDTLAVAYAAAGRFDEAIATAQTAIELARSNGQTQLVSQIEMRLAHYRKGSAAVR